ncbi:MAG TPA: hypothetical protein VHZ75_03170, partial [Solirubrobacteraceae bacterium]|nr:hypothetical protein [Solirubrobacteraceae bacterium]
MTAPVQLSVVCVVGAQRARARRLVAVVADQRMTPRLKVIVVDGGSGEDRIDAPGLDATHVPVEPGTELGAARATGL